MEKPVITSCIRFEKRGKRCDNKVIFEYFPMYNRKGEIVEWEVECPMCGEIWWISDRNKVYRPQLYKKSVLDKRKRREKNKKEKKRKN